MIKTILYTKNPVEVYSFPQVVIWAEDNNCYYRCLVNENSPLFNAKEGTCITTTKGNELWVIETSFRKDAFPFAKFSSITTPVKIEQITF